MYNTTAGQVLGVTTGVAAGIAFLPNTGNSPLAMFLTTFAITCGVIVLLSFVITKILIKILTK